MYCTGEGWECSIWWRCRGSKPVSTSGWCTESDCLFASASSRTPAPQTWTAGWPQLEKMNRSNSWVRSQNKLTLFIHVKVKMFYLILNDPFNPSSGKIETVTKCKIAAYWRLGATASEFLQLFLHGTVFPENEAWQKKKGNRFISTIIRSILFKWTFTWK